MHALTISSLCDALRRGEREEALTLSVLASLPTSSGYMSLEFGKFLGTDSVFGTMTMGEALVETLISNRFFVSGYQKFEARDHAISLGYRIASRVDNEAYINDLLEKQGRNTLSEVEVKAIDFYLRGFVCDTDGRLSVVDGRVRGYPHDRARSLNWEPYASLPFGFLMVRLPGDSAKF